MPVRGAAANRETPPANPPSESWTRSLPPSCRLRTDRQPRHPYWCRQCSRWESSSVREFSGRRCAPCRARRRPTVPDRCGAVLEGWRRLRAPLLLRVRPRTSCSRPAPTSIRVVWRTSPCWGDSLEDHVDVGSGKDIGGRVVEAPGRELGCRRGRCEGRIQLRDKGGEAIEAQYGGGGDRSDGTGAHAESRHE